MSKSTDFAAPLELTERAKTPFGLMRVVLDIYSSGALSVTLATEKKASETMPSIMLSADIANAEQLARGEFVAACRDVGLTSSLLHGGLFRTTGRRLAEEAVWSLDGLAMIEFQSAFQPPLAASRVSFPTHLFSHRDFDSKAQKRLIQVFEADGCTRHSAQGASIWVVKQYCEKHKLPFSVSLLKEQDATIGVLVCKRAVAAAMQENESQSGIMVQIVYESPAYS